MTFRTTETPFNIATTEAPENAEAELQELREKFAVALRDRVQRGLPNVLKIRENCRDRFFYVLERGTVKSEPGRTQEQLRCMREDFEIFDVTRTVTVIANLAGAAQIDHSFTKVEHVRAISGAEAGKLVKRVIENAI